MTAKNILFTTSAVLGVAIRIIILVNNVRRLYTYERNGGEPVEIPRTKSNTKR